MEINRSKRHSFTLLELFLTLALLAMLGSFFLVSGKDMISKYRQDKEIQEFNNHLTLVKRLADGYEMQVDIEMNLSQSTLIYKTKSDAPLHKIHPLLTQKRKIHAVQRLFLGDDEAHECTLHFLGNGRYFPIERLYLLTTNGKKILLK